MPTNVVPSELFNKQIRRLARKFPAVLDELELLYHVLKDDERPGDKIPNVGYETYKVRLKNPSAKKGKSGGFRVIYYVYIADMVILLTIYSKTEQTNISPEDIQKIIDNESLPSNNTDDNA